MTDQAILDAQWARYTQRIEGLMSVAIKSGLMPVAELLGGLTIEGCSDPMGIRALPINHKSIMEAIAKQVIPVGWEYEVVAVVEDPPQIVLLRYPT